jgi:hypothetical protein
MSTNPCVITVVQPTVGTVTTDCETVTVAVSDEVVTVKAGEVGAQGAPGTGGAWGTFVGDITTQADLQAQFDTKLDASGDQIQNFSEGNETLTFTAGAATLAVDTCENAQSFSLVANSAITTSGTPTVFKPRFLWWLTVQ